MAVSGTASLTIAELREFASFGAAEQRFIEQALAVAADPAESSPQADAYRELRRLRAHVPDPASLAGTDGFLGTLVRITAADLAQDQLAGFSAYRFLYERLLGAAARPWLPAAFCGAAALPQIRPARRKLLLQSLSEAAATAPAWSAREPSFFPERIAAEAA